MHENQTTFSGTLPPDVKSVLLAGDERSIARGSDGDDHHRQAKHWVPHKVGKLRNC